MKQTIFGETVSRIAVCGLQGLMTTSYFIKFLTTSLLRIAVNGLERKFDNAEVATIKKGLQDVRDMVNDLLDEINAKTRSNPRLEASQDGMCPALRWENI